MSQRAPEPERECPYCRGRKWVQWGEEIFPCRCTNPQEAHPTMKEQMT